MDLNPPRYIRYSWWFLNWAINHYFPNKIKPEIRIKNHQIDLDNWDTIEKYPSPSRKLSDLFWLQLPWPQINQELHEINMLDVGCGSGNYYHKLTAFSHHRISKYIGLDKKFNTNWHEILKRNPNAHFIVADCQNNLNNIIPEGINFIFSQSVIEHLEEDLSFYKQINRFIQKSKKTTLQIHLFPSSSCLITYMFHGIRQYTPRTISKITSIFDDYSICVLYKLGGKYCNTLHWSYFTKPSKFYHISDFHIRYADKYEKALYDAISKDSSQNVTSRNPTFYALIIHSFPKNNIF